MYAIQNLLAYLENKINFKRMAIKRDMMLY